MKWALEAELSGFKCHLYTKGFIGRRVKSTSNKIRDTGVNVAHSGNRKWLRKAGSEQWSRHRGRRPGEVAKGKDAKASRDWP